MKYKTLIAAAVLSVVAVTGGIGCLVSGMLIEGSLVPVAVIAAATALAGGFCLQRRLSYAPAIVLGILGLLLWFIRPLNRSAEYLVWYVSSLYDVGYGWGVLRWSKESLSQANATLVLCYIAGWLSLAVTCSVIKQKRNFLGVAAVLLPLLPCLVLTDTVPGTGYLFAELLCFGILLLTQTVRNQNPQQANRLSALLAVPLAVALGLLLLLCPRETYTGQAGAEKLEEWIVSWFQVELPDAPKPPVKLSVAADVGATEVELDKVGPQDPGVQVTLWVQAEKTGTLYLRGSAYDQYDGTQWTISQGIWDSDGAFAPATGRAYAATITTPEPHKVRYFAYSPMDDLTFQNGRQENTDGITEYVIHYGATQGYQSAWEELRQPILGWEMGRYLLLPEETANAAREYLRTSVGFPKDTMTAGDIYRYATTVSALVRNSANYDLNTAEMPGDEKDFALWFLRESDTGYCVHYASAAAVLLRAAGIPARYVSGYLVQTRAGQTVNVRHKDAHAWVEYYIPGVGWMMLEATASGGDSPVVITTQPPETIEETTENSVETTVAPTEQATEPTQTTVLPEPETQDPSWMGKLLLWLLVVALILAQWRLRVSLRHRRKGKPNARALQLWQEVALHARLLGTKPDSRLHALAQKAKFSREIITSSELRQFEESLKNSRNELRKKPIWNQLIYTLILALY